MRSWDLDKLAYAAAYLAGDHYSICGSVYHLKALAEGEAFLNAQLQRMRAAMGPVSLVDDITEGYFNTGEPPAA